MKQVRAAFCNTLERGEAEYLIEWDDFPNDHKWYRESELEDAE